MKLGTTQTCNNNNSKPLNTIKSITINDVSNFTPIIHVLEYIQIAILTSNKTIQYIQTHFKFLSKTIVDKNAVLK